MKKILAIILGIIISPSIVNAVYLPVQGGTGTSTIPSFGQILMGNGLGIYGLYASTTLPYIPLSASTSLPYIPLSASTSLAYIPFASSTLYVPYIGANTIVDLGSQNLTTSGSVNSTSSIVSNTATVAELCFSGTALCMTAPSVSGSQIALYYWTTASDIAGYERLRITPDTSAQVIDTATSSSNNLVLIDSYVSTTTDLSITSIPAGLWEFHDFANIDSSVGNSYIIHKVYIRNQSGNEAFYFQATSSALTTGLKEYVYTEAISATTTAVTDRIVIKNYFIASSGTTKNVSFYYGGQSYYSHVHTSIDISAGNYTRANVNETITGNWIHTGTLTLATTSILQLTLGNGLTNAVLAVDGSGKLVSTTTNAGTVTAVTVTTANGVSASVANQGTTPALTFTLGAITPTTVNGLTFATTTTGYTVSTTSQSLNVIGSSTLNNAYVSGINTGDNTNAIAIGTVATSGTANQHFYPIFVPSSSDSNQVPNLNSGFYYVPAGQLFYTPNMKTNNNGLFILDQGGNYSQRIVPSETNTNTRDLDLKLNDASRILSLSGDLTVPSNATTSGTNTGDQTITLTGDVTGSGTGSFNPTLVLQCGTSTISNQTASGQRTSNLYGTSTAMQLVNFFASTTGNGYWSPANANASTTASSTGMLGIALTTQTISSLATVAMSGSCIRNDSWNFATGSQAYVATTTSGTFIVAVPPATPVWASGNIVRPIGYMLAQNILYFKPSDFWVAYK